MISFITLLLSITSASNLPNYLFYLDSDIQIEDCILDKSVTICEKYEECKYKLHIEVSKIHNVNTNPYYIEYTFNQNPIKLSSTRFKKYKYSKPIQIAIYKELEYAEIHTDAEGYPIYIKLRKYKSNPFEITKNVECGQKQF